MFMFGTLSVAHTFTCVVCTFTKLKRLIHLFYLITMANLLRLSSKNTTKLNENIFIIIGKNFVGILHICYTFFEKAYRKEEKNTTLWLNIIVYHIDSFFFHRVCISGSLDDITSCLKSFSVNHTKYFVGNIFYNNNNTKIIFLCTYKFLFMSKNLREEISFKNPII